jgi:hypothetical protein
MTSEQPMPNQKHNAIPVAARFLVLEKPIKSSDTEQIPRDLLDEQAELAIASIHKLSYTQVRGTCVDERRRIGLRNQSRNVEPRPSVPGGPNIYGLAVAELTGYFVGQNLSGEERLHRVTGRLNDAGIRSGGHVDCKANGSFNLWMQTIADNPDYVMGYAALRFGEDFNPTLMYAVVNYARAAVTSKRYLHWNETKLIDELGEDEAGEAIEILDNVEHGGFTLIRNWIPESTVDQTEVYDQNYSGRGVGLGSFVNDEGYADTIEHVMTPGPDAIYKKLLAEYAREAILAAVAAAVPNREIYQTNLYELAA